MTDINTAAMQPIFDELCARSGGIDAMTALDREIAATIAKMLIAIRSTEGSEAAKIAETVSRLQSQLPVPAADAADEPIDLRRLSDAELIELDRLTHKACDKSYEPWSPPVEKRRRRGRAERIGSDLGRMIDGKGENWRASEAEAVELRNEFSRMLPRTLTMRSLFDPIYGGEVALAREAALAEASRNAETETAEAASPPSPPPKVERVPGPNDAGFDPNVLAFSRRSFGDHPGG